MAHFIVASMLLPAMGMKAEGRRLFASLVFFWAVGGTGLSQTLTELEQREAALTLELNSVKQRIAELRAAQPPQADAAAPLKKGSTRPSVNHRIHHRVTETRSSGHILLS